MNKRKELADNKKLSSEKEEFESKVDDVIFRAIIDNLNMPSIDAGIREALWKNLEIPKENVNIGVDEDFVVHWVEIKTTKYGDLEFDFTVK